MVALGARSGAPPFFVSAFLPRVRPIDTTPCIWIRRRAVSVDGPAMGTTGRRIGTSGWIPVRRAVVSIGGLAMDTTARRMAATGCRSVRRAVVSIGGLDIDTTGRRIGRRSGDRYDG